MVQSALTKTLLTGVIAGVVGGGAILYGQQGVQLLQNQNQKVSNKYKNDCQECNCYISL